MNKKTKEKLLDVAAELVVSPLALYAKASELKDKFDESETGKTINSTLQQAGDDVAGAAKSFAESETGQLIKDTAVKVKTEIVKAYDDVVAAGTEFGAAAKNVFESVVGPGEEIDLDAALTEEAEEAAEEVAEEAAGAVEEAVEEEPEA